MRTRRDWDVDHLDPRWKEGRDYQLVCGLNCLRNLNELDRSFNVTKSNRFLPWRWSRGEIGVVPQEFGDLCLFLDPDTNEWVLEEFLGEWWFEKTLKVCASYWVGVRSTERLNQDLRKWKSERPEEFNREIKRLHLAHKQWREREPERMSELGCNVRRAKDQWAEENPELEIERIKKFEDNAKNLKFICTVTGFMSNAAGLKRYQIKRGIDPSSRRRVDLRDER
jgi:hypothetical protein